LFQLNNVTEKTLFSAIRPLALDEEGTSGGDREEKASLHLLKSYYANKVALI
jgi:hypothetical protein